MRARLAVIVLVVAALGTALVVRSEGGDSTPRLAPPPEPAPSTEELTATVAPTTVPAQSAVDEEAAGDLGEVAGTALGDLTRQGLFIPVGRPIPSVPQDPDAALQPDVVALCDRVSLLLVTAQGMGAWDDEEVATLRASIESLQADLAAVLDEHGESHTDAVYDCFTRLQELTEDG